MPLPKPRENETEQKFIARFMSDETMQKEYPDQKQRVAVAYSQFKEKTHNEKITFTDEQAKSIYDACGEECKRFQLKDIHLGLNEELEHIDTVKGDLNILLHLVLDHLKKDVKYYEKEMEMQNNSKDWAWVFDCAFFEPGIVSYKDIGKGVYLLQKGCIDACINTFKGRPLIINHDDNITPETMEGKAQGYITDVFYCAEDGMYHASGICFGDEAKNKIELENWSVSCTYGILKADERGGVWHNNPYDREILEFTGNHIAVVKTPRYENSKINFIKEVINA